MVEMQILFLVKWKELWRVLNRRVIQIASLLVLKDYPGCDAKSGFRGGKEGESRQAKKLLQ